MASIVPAIGAAFQTPPLPLPETASRPAPRGDRFQPRSYDDFEQIVREARLLLRQGDDGAALAALQRLAQRAPREVLAALSEQHALLHGVSLEQLLAQTRLRQARSGRRGFQLRFVTPFEARAFAQLLEQEVTAALQRRFGERTLAAWAAQPTAYKLLRPDAAVMVREMQQASAMIAARLKHDPAIRRDEAERRRLNDLREQLAGLSSHVTSLPGFTALSVGADAEDPTLRVAEQLASEQDDAPDGDPAGTDPNAAAPPVQEQDTGSAASRPRKPAASAPLPPAPRGDPP